MTANSYQRLSWCKGISSDYRALSSIAAHHLDKPNFERICQNSGVYTMTVKTIGAPRFTDSMTASGKLGALQS